jgi:beta-galactosidase
MKIFVPFLIATMVFSVSCTTEKDFPSQQRQKISLNNDWEFKLESNPTDWEHVNIPHTWNNIDMQTQRNNFYEGLGLYRKNFTPDSTHQGKRIFIRFEGVASVMELRINDQFVGNHFGGYSAFAFDITEYLKLGAENELLVKVDNSSRPDVIPINHRLFGVYGGIYRPVHLIVTDQINITVTDYASPGVYLTQTNVSSQSAQLEVKVKIDNKTMRSNELKVRTRIYDMEGNFKQDITKSVKLASQGRQIVTQNLKIKRPRLWQGLEDPYLYKAVVQLIRNDTIIDEVVQPIGFRHFEFLPGEGMFLNGKQTPMYGVCRHQDWWEIGSALENEHHDTDLEIIKEMGATTIRLAHYQQSEYFYAKCDSLGFLVWAEIPFVNRVSTQEFNNAKQQLTELIRQNYNHPSIYVWGLHNEVYRPSGYVISLTEDLNDLAKTEDPYRYTVQVSGYNRIDHEVNNNADIQGINQYFGWYNGTLDSLQTWVNRIEKQYPEHMVIFSEYGTEANIHQQREVVSNRGDCCGFDKDYNETFATRFHEEHWNVISRHPYLLASYIWNTFDFATPMSSQGKVEARNMKGLVTFDRKTKKDPFYWYKANWSTEPVLYITQRRVVNRGNKMTPITLYSNIGTPALFVNGIQINDYIKGYTDIHYIFPDVELNEGENSLIAKIAYNGEMLKDSVFWNYSEDFKELDNNAPTVRLNEHVGL